MQKFLFKFLLTIRTDDKNVKERYNFNNVLAALALI